MTTPKAINDIVTALGGESSADKTVPALQAVYAALGGDGAFPDTIPEALEKIASVAEPPVPEPTGAISITANGNDIDVAQYATANVNVPASAVVSGTKSITANGTNIDVTDYAAVDVNVGASVDFVDVYAVAEDFPVGNAPRISSVYLNNGTICTKDSNISASQTKYTLPKGNAVAKTDYAMRVRFNSQVVMDTCNVSVPEGAGSVSLIGKAASSPWDAYYYVFVNADTLITFKYTG